MHYTSQLYTLLMFNKIGLRVCVCVCVKVESLPEHFFGV